MEKIIPQYDGENKGHYTPGIISNGMLYIYGQLSIDPDTLKVPEGGIKAHARLALANVERALKATGLFRTVLSSVEYMYQILTNGIVLTRFIQSSSVNTNLHAVLCL